MSLVPCFVEVYHIWTLTEQSKYNIQIFILIAMMEFCLKFKSLIHVGQRI